MCCDTALARRVDLSRGRADGVEAAWSRDDAIDATAVSPTRRDGPDAFQRLKIEEKTTRDMRRRRAL